MFHFRFHQKGTQYSGFFLFILGNKRVPGCKHEISDLGKTGCVSISVTKDSTHIRAKTHDNYEAKDF